MAQGKQPACTEEQRNTICMHIRMHALAACSQLVIQLASNIAIATMVKQTIQLYYALQYYYTYIIVIYVQLHYNFVEYSYIGLVQFQNQQLYHWCKLLQHIYNLLQLQDSYAFIHRIQSGYLAGCMAWAHDYSYSLLNDIGRIQWYKIHFQTSTTFLASPIDFLGKGLEIPKIPLGTIPIIQSGLPREFEGPRAKYM